MNVTPPDVRELSQANPQTTAPTIAHPPFRWKSRILLPGVIALTIIALLLLTAAETLMPATSVRIVQKERTKGRPNWLRSI